MYRGRDRPAMYAESGGHPVEQSPGPQAVNVNANGDVPTSAVVGRITARRAKALTLGRMIAGRSTSSITPPYLEGYCSKGPNPQPVSLR